MKKIFLLSMLVCFVMICSCQKKDSGAEDELGQRKVELDAREEELAERKTVLDERERALDEREKVLAQKEKATLNAQTNPPAVQGQIADPAEVQAEKERLIQDLSVRVPDHSQRHAEKAEVERKVQEQRAQTQPQLEELQREKQRKIMGMAGDAVFPAPAGTSPASSPAEASSPSPSAAIEATSPSPARTP